MSWGWSIYFVSKPWDDMFNLEDLGFQPQKLDAIQMHILQSIVTNGRVEYLQWMPRWGRNANGFYYKHMCITYSCIYMQGWLHDGEHLHVNIYDFGLQGHVHHTYIVY